MTEAEIKYASIINLPHHTSPTRPRMSNKDRAAQFAPFAALTGYEQSVFEAERLTTRKMELSEDMKAELNEKIQMLLDYLDDEPVVSITYFVPDKKKAGGAYVTASGVVREINDHIRTIIFIDGTIVPIEQIYDINGDLFNGFE